VYVTGKSLKEREDRESDYALRFRQAFASGDQKGMDNLSKKYLEIGGDPQVLFNSPEIMEAMERASVDQRTRMAGKLAATQKSLRRWQELHPGQRAAKAALLFYRSILVIPIPVFGSSLLVCLIASYAVAPVAIAPIAKFIPLPIA
jgi:hypothetical protein